MLNGRKEGPKRGFLNRSSPSPRAARYCCQSGGTDAGSRRKSSYSLSTKARLAAFGGNGAILLLPFICYHNTLTELIFRKAKDSVKGRGSRVEGARFFLG